MAHHERPDRQQPERDRGRERGDREHRRRGSRGRRRRGPRSPRGPSRCGSSEVWIAWNSCSGARAISSTSNTMPASALSGEVAATVSTAAFSSVCSESMIPETQPAKPVPRRSESSSWAPPPARPRSPGPASAASASSAVIGPASAASASASALLAGSSRAPRAAPGARVRTPPARRSATPAAPRRCRARPRSGRWRCRPRRRARSTGAKRLHQHEPAVQREVLVPREPAAREVARGVGERADDEDVVERLVVVEHVVDEPFVEHQRDDQEGEREAGLDRDRDAQRVLGPGPAPAARRSCARAAVRSAGRSPR